MMKIDNKNYLLYFILFFILIEGIYFSIENNRLNQEFENENTRLLRVQSILKDTPVFAKAYSIYDITIGQKIYGKNDEVPMPLASLVKTMTTIIALNNYKEDGQIIISKNAINQAGDFGIYANEKWNMSDLIKLTLISSANDGAYAMSEQDDHFLEKMNSKAIRLGMNNTLFLNSTGLDLDSERAGGFTSAYDANLMAGFALKYRPSIFSNTTMSEIILKSESGFLHNVKNTNILINKIPGILFSKTGYTNIAGGNLTIVFKDKRKHDIAITVLGSTFNERFSDMEKLVNALELSYTE